jgi:hypothetical protein
VTLAACADGQFGLVAPFAVVISWWRGWLSDPKSAEIMPSVLVPRVVAALQTKRLGPMAPARRRDRAVPGTSSAGARLFCAEAHAVRCVGAAVARGAAGAVALVHRYYLE